MKSWPILFPAVRRKYPVLAWGHYSFFELVRAIGKFPQIVEAEDAGIMAVGKVEIQRIAADDRDVGKRHVVADLIVVEDLLTGPFVDAACARARAA